MSDFKKTTVYGRGVSGLIAACYLVQKGFQVEVVDPFEDSKIKTLKTKDGLIELAANSILYNAEVKRFLNEIGLEYEFYSDLGKKKFIHSKAHGLKRWPLSFIETLINLIPLFKMGFKSKSLKPNLGEAIEDWALKHFSPAFLDKLLAPALKGVYGASTKNLSASLVLKNLFLKKEKSKQRGSVSFKNGMGDFIKAMESYLLKNGVKFLKEESEEKDAFKVVSSPAWSLPSCVCAEHKKLLQSVEYKEVSTLTLFFKEKERLPLKAFGVIFKDEESVQGLIINSDLFENRAEKGLVSETWIFDGEKTKSEDVALKEVLALRKRNFNTEGDPVSLGFKYWEKAFPFYNLNLEKTLENLEQGRNNVYYFANWTGAIGIGGMIQQAPSYFEKIKTKAL